MPSFFVFNLFFLFLCRPITSTHIFSLFLFYNNNETWTSNKSTAKKNKQRKTENRYATTMLTHTQFIHTSYWNNNNNIMHYSHNNIMFLILLVSSSYIVFAPSAIISFFFLSSNFHTIAAKVYIFIVHTDVQYCAAIALGKKCRKSY